MNIIGPGRLTARQGAKQYNKWFNIATGDSQTDTARSHQQLQDNR